MVDTAGTWLMTTLSTSPLHVALMQTAASLPVLVLGLPAGALADILDRRRLLLFWVTWMVGAASVLAILTSAGWIGVASLLIFTCLLSVGSAMNGPIWQGIVPELVPREQLPSAIALNSAAFNITRAIGPAAGGLTVAAFAGVAVGAGVVYWVNALSFIGVFLVIFFWKRKPLFKSELPAERLAGSMRAALRYVSTQDGTAVTADLKKIYQAATVVEAEQALENFAQAWDAKYPTIAKMWRAKWSDIITLFDFPPAIRRAIYTTNAIESVNSVIRKFTRNRKIYPNEESALKIVYMAIHEASKKWTMPIRNWKAALNHFAILFEDRLPMQLS